jgi:tripeptidyl-peptidase-1
MLKIRIALKQGNFQALEKDLLEVSDPDHARYGKHLSSDEVHAHTAPSVEALDAVHQWLQGHDIFADQLEYSAPKDWVIVSLPVAKVEKLLDTEYHEYEHIDGTQVVRTTQYSLPKSLQRHVDIVAPTNYFGNPKFFGSTVRIAEESTPDNEIAASSLDATAAPLGCLTTGVTLNCVRSLYQTIDYTPKVPNKVGLP